MRSGDLAANWHLESGDVQSERGGHLIEAGTSLYVRSSTIDPYHGVNKTIVLAAGNPAHFTLELFGFSLR